MATFSLRGGAEIAIHKVSELQKDYKTLIDEAISGRDVLLTRVGEEVAALIDIRRYLDAQKHAARCEELTHEIERLRASLALAMAGGPSLKEAREQARRDPGVLIDDLISQQD